MAAIRVTTSELDYPGDGVAYLNGEPFTGFEVFHDGLGWECAEHEYRDGLLFGLERAWHRSGVLALEAECSLGVRHGRCREWHESRRKRARLVSGTNAISNEFHEPDRVIARTAKPSQRGVPIKPFEFGVSPNKNGS